MSLTDFALTHIRNITEAQLDLSPQLNLIVGENASGKTSLLEALHILSSARSFRTTHIREVIQHGKDHLSVFGRKRDAHSEIPLGLKRNRKTLKIRIGGEDIHQASILARHLPVQLLNPEAHALLEQGPKQRRQFLDWGVFHVEQTYLQVWHQYHRALRQRNAALRIWRGVDHVKAWNQTLAETATNVQHYRERYLEAVTPLIQEYAQNLMDFKPELNYAPGWPSEQAYAEYLTVGIDGDRERGFTRHGPHRAEIGIRVNDVPVQACLSRGQQKLLVSAMRLAQMTYLQQQQPGKQGLILVDDLPAELDSKRRHRLLNLLVETGAQIVLTATEPDLLDLSGWSETKMFHVKRGEVREVV